LGSSASNGVKLEDVDQDGDLDAFVVDGNFWLNDGAGNFSITGFSTGGQEVIFGDLDADGDQDAFLAIRWGNKLWYNNYVPEVTSGATLNYTENDGPSAIDSSILLYDFDNSAFAGATIEISANYVEMEDELSFTPIGSITGAWDSASATLTLSGTGSDTEYAAALASVTYENMSENPFTASRTVSFTINDGMATSQVATATVNVAAVNDAPFLDNSGTPTLTAITEDDSASPAYSMHDLFSIFGHLIGDPDYHDQLGLAITGADNSNGNWQYSTDGGTNWSNIGAVSDATALLLQAPPKLFGEVQNTTDLAANDLLINGNDVGPVTLSTSLVNGLNMQGAYNLANAINAISGSTGVIAELDTLYAGGGTTGGLSGDSIDFNINGVSVGVTLPTSYTAYEVAQAIASAINDVGPSAHVHAWVGTGSNGGAVNSVVIGGHGNNIVIANLVEVGTAVSGLANGTYALDSTHNMGDVFLIPTGGSYSVTTSAGDDSILALIGMDGGVTQTNISGDTADDGVVNVSFPLNKLRYVPDGDFSGTATLTFRAWDQTNAMSNGSTDSTTVNGGSSPYSAASETISITVNPVNDAPVVTSGAVFNYTENDTPMLVGSGVTLTDIDNANLASAAINVSGNYVEGEDVLSFTSVGNISGTWNSSTATLTLSGTDTVANYLSALASVTYQNLSDNPSVLSRTISFTANDGTATSAAATAIVNVTAVNDAPTVSGTATMSAVYLTDIDNGGDLVGNFIGTVVIDPDSAVKGIAVTGLDTTVGSWQYSLDSGASWQDFGPLSDTSATLLADSARIRLVPNGIDLGTSGLIFHGWDQTSGSNGLTGVDVTVNGGGTAFSTEATTATVTVQELIITPTTTTTTIIDTSTTLDIIDSATSTMTTDSLLTAELLTDVPITDFLITETDITTEAPLEETADQATESDEEAEAEESEEELQEEEDSEEADEEELVDDEAVVAAAEGEGATAKGAVESEAKNGKKGLSGQLAKEKMTPEAERAEIIKIFDEVFDLLQCK
jgi:regulator of protease activity HflC (stomatin/prohibitin superfamily)